jgi:CBS domain-containing protein
MMNDVPESPLQFEDFRQTMSALEESLLVQSIMSYPLASIAKDRCPVRFFDDARHADFDCAPVTNGSRVIGMIHRSDVGHRIPDSCLAGDTGILRPLHMVPIVAATEPVAHLLRMMRDTSDHHWLVLKGKEVSAIVTRSDVWKMPVRMLLICRMLHLEQLIALAIRKHSTHDAWMSLLSPSRQAKILDHFASVKRHNEHVDMLESTNYSDKVVIIGRIQPSTTKLRLSSLDGLRNLLMHGREGHVGSEGVIKLLQWHDHLDTCLAGVRELAD